MPFSFSTELRFNSSAQQKAGVYNSTRGPTGTHLRKIGRRVSAAARRQVGKDTYDLARSIYFNVKLIGGMPGVEIGATDDIALIHHEGTRPHLISARNAQFLRFSSRGRIVYQRDVWHPGTPANKYLTDNLYLARL